MDRRDDGPVARIGVRPSGLAGLTHNRRQPDPSEGRTGIRCHVPAAGHVGIEALARRSGRAGFHPDRWHVVH